MEKIRIFIASPSDVAEERILAYHVIERLRAEFAAVADVRSVIWEHEPLLATADFQSQIGTPATSDIFVMLMWSRFGSPLGAEFTRADGSRYDSATEYEFEQAMTAFNTTGTPKMLVYRKTTVPSLSDESSMAQYDAVDRFFTKWFINTDDQTAKAAFHNFSDVARFEDVLEIHLRKSLQGFLPNPTNLPAAVNAFIGRGELTDKVLEMLRGDEFRLVALVGPGGAGKSRLAVHLGNELLPQFEDGVFFISLAAVTDPELVPSAIANTLGIKLSAEPELVSVIRDLKRKRMLLLMDNLEQVQAAGKYLSEILAECPQVRAIVTSREALRLRGASTVRVPPLALPGKGSTDSLPDLQQYEAIRLFVSRAQAVKDDFELTADNAKHVIDICRRVDALPLAIELAASRIRLMSPERLALALAQRFRVLTGGADDLLDHQKSLRGLIAWSYDLLDEAEKTLWCRLAIFADGCEIEDAQLVCDPANDYFMELDIEPLVDKSLISIQHDASSGQARITMLESLREFAREQLLQSSEYNVLQQRYCDWCIEIGFISEDTAMNSGFEQRLGRLDGEVNNLRSALDYCLVEKQAETALRICGGLYQYWLARGLLIEGERWIDKALALGGDELGAMRGRALKGLSTLLRFQHRLDDAERHANAALYIFTHLDEQKTRANVLCELGAISQHRGNFDAATDYLNECMTLTRAQVVADQSLSYYLIVRGVTEHLQGDLGGAKNSYMEGLSLGQAAGDKSRTAMALLNLAEIIEEEGKSSQAYTYYRDSLQIWGELRHKLAVARCAEMLAGLEVRINNRPEEASFLFGAAQAIREDLDVPVERYNMPRFTADVELTLAAVDQQEPLASWNAGRALGFEGILRHVQAGADNNRQEFLSADGI
ncbi:MAG: putative ATPase [Bacteroidia bacterium]|jgi:predicted ATPase